MPYNPGFGTCQVSYATKSCRDGRGCHSHEQHIQLVTHAVKRPRNSRESLCTTQEADHTTLVHHTAAAHPSDFITSPHPLLLIAGFPHQDRQDWQCIQTVASCRHMAAARPVHLDTHAYSNGN
jgi:hypothetical protein